MSFWNRLFKPKVEDYSISSRYRFLMGPTAAGKSVNERSAMQLTAVYACVRILAEGIAGLPLHLYKCGKNGSREKAVDHPLYFLLHDEPNPEMTSFVFRETLMTHLLLYGNCYCQIIRDGRGQVAALYPLMSNQMSVDRDEKGQLYYTYLRSIEETDTMKKGTVYLLQEIQSYGEEIARLEQLQSMEDTLRRPTAVPLTARPGNKAGWASNEYKNALLTALRTNFKDVDNILREGQDESDGYLVPDEYDHRLVEALEQENIFRKLATTINTTGLHKINVPAVKPAAAWVEEGEALTFSDATFNQVILDAYKLHVAVKVSEELLYDNAFNLETYLLNSFAKALGNAEEEAFLTGDGKNKPTGILNATGGGEVGVTTTADSIKADEVIDLVYKLKRPYRKNAAFITSDSTLAQIRKLKDSNGNYLWQPALTAGEPDRILGYPVYTSVYMPKIA